VSYVLKRFGHKVLWAPVAAVVGVLVGGTAAFADPVDTGFTDAQTTLTGYLGDAAVFIVVIASIAVGLLLLRKWMKRAAST
jgi:uncharacterized membrane protein